MIIGRLSTDNTLALAMASERHCLLYNFSLTPAPSGLSFEGMPDSAYATPARYLLEMIRRIRERHPDGRITLINPLHDLDYIHFLKVVALLQADYPAAGNFVIAEATGRPLAYVLDSSITDFTLSLVSTVSASLDSKLLSKLLGEKVQIITAKWRLGTATRYNRLYSVANLDIYCWLTQHALVQLSQFGKAQSPIAAIMPYHAGDAIFFALAASRTESAISQVAVCKDYLEIVEQHAPKLATIEIDLPPPFRNGWKVSEEDYFLHHLNAVLPEGNLYVYLRPSGDYNRTRFHLIDHFAFALGASPRQPDDLVWSRSAPPGKPMQFPARILLHFDAGWPMKVYPEDKQKRLIDLLLTKGHRVTVLAKADAQYTDYRSVAFRNYPDLLNLLAEHDFVVGMDSFPAHLAAHSLGLPTICLFSSTRPENSNAPSSSRYAYLEKGLPCCPCYAMTRCPVYGGDECLNFVSPEEVALNINCMLNQTTDPTLASVLATDLSSSPRINVRPAPKRINTVHLEKLGYAILLAYLNPLNHMGYIHQVSDEFIMAWRKQGMRKALFKAARFMLRKAMRH